MVRLRNVWDATLSMFHPAGHQDSLTVEPGQVAEVPGELAVDQPHPDAIAVEDGHERRLYPKAQWEHVPDVDMDATPTEVPQPPSRARRSAAPPATTTTGEVS